MSERRACRTLGQHRSTQRKVPQGRADEDRLTVDIIELARQYGDAPKVFDPAECVLDEMSITVSHLAIYDLPLAV